MEQETEVQPELQLNDVSVITKKKKRFWIIFGSVTGAIVIILVLCLGLGIGLTRRTNTTTTTIAATTTCGSSSGSALLLSDTNTATVQTLVSALQSAGLTVNYLPGGISNYSGTPDASCYSSVLLVPGSFLSIDMPTSGQQSILNAQQTSGVGIVMTEFVASQMSSGKFATLSPLLLAPYVSGTVGTMDFVLVYSGHPIWNGLATSFTTAVTINYCRFGNPISGSIIVANSTVATTTAVIVYPKSGTAGRIVQIAHGGHYSFASTFNWGNDANVLNMMINAVKWAVQLI